MGPGRAWPGLALIVGSRAGSRRRPPDDRARCLAGATDGDLCGFSTTPPPAVAGAPVHRPLARQLRPCQLLGNALSPSASERNRPGVLMLMCLSELICLSGHLAWRGRR